MTYYVKMTDNFMSGWGKAEGRKNVLQIECDNYQQAEQIEAHAQTRSEMSNVRIDATPYKGRAYLSEKHYSDMGGCWIQQGGRIAS